MANLNFFIGKIPNPKNNQNLQLQGKYYEADKKWFNGLQPGDYAFIISDKKVLFWKALKWQTVNGYNRMVFQELVNDCGIKPIQFSALNYFNLDINNTVKATRSTAKEKKGFFPLSLDSNNRIDVNNLSIQTADLRKVVLYSSLAEAHKDKNAAGDIQIYLDNTEFKIINKSFIHWNKPFISNPAPSGKNKIKTLAKFKLSSGTLKKVINVSIQDFYDLFFSNLVPTNKRVKTKPTPSGGNLTTNNKQSLNLILYGPPGTGKTYHTIDKTLEIIDNQKIHKTDRFEDLRNQGRILFTTFHQSMSYEDFIEGIKPEYDKKAKTLSYPVKLGLFMQICEKARKDVGNPYVLIIDEINRGNVANIFGELITLIEDNKREKLRVKLPYSNKDFTIPKNLFIIGTMNTADRSVEALDTALRRRFRFEEMMPNSELLKNDGTNTYWEFTDNNHKFLLKDILDTINSRIEVLKDRDHLIGHSYFMEFKDTNNITTEEMKDIFFDKIIPLLQEYFYGDYEKIQLVLGNGFIDEKTVDVKKLFAGGKTYDGVPEKIYHIKPKDNIDMVNALKSMGILNWKDNSIGAAATIQPSETKILENESQS